MNTRHKNKKTTVEPIQNETQKEFRKMNCVISDLRYNFKRPTMYIIGVSKAEKREGVTEKNI